MIPPTLLRLSPETMMRLQIGATLTLALAAATAAAAADDLKSSPYYPLKVGAAWSYKAGDGKFTLRVAKTEKVKDDVCARVEYVRESKAEGSELIAVKDDGVFRFAFDDKTAEPPLLFLKLPPKKGETWKVESKVKGKTEETIKGTFKSGEEEVKVPAGNYKCIVVSCDDLDANGMKMAVTCYYAENVGLVKQVIEAAGQKTVIELEKYEPAK
jgi:hypothetical protein